MNKLTKLPPAWHAEAVDLLKKNFAGIHSAFLDSTKKAVWLGIFLNEIKRRGKEDRSIPHGEFIPWLDKNLPDIHQETCRTYMRLGREVCEKGKFQIADFPQYSQGNLPAEALKLIEGKTQKQLFLEWKQVDGDGNARVGRLPGEGGSRKLSMEEQRVKSVEGAFEHSGLMCKAVLQSNKDFCLTAEQNDLEINAEISVLEFALKIRHKYINTPRSRRDDVLPEILSLIAKNPIKL
jgi:hypothetical protein